MLVTFSLFVSSSQVEGAGVGAEVVGGSVGAWVVEALVVLGSVVDGGADDGNALGDCVAFEALPQEADQPLQVKKFSKLQTEDSWDAIVSFQSVAVIDEWPLAARSTNTEPPTPYTATSSANPAVVTLVGINRFQAVATPKNPIRIEMMQTASDGQKAIGNRCSKNMNDPTQEIRARMPPIRNSTESRATAIRAAMDFGVSRRFRGPTSGIDTSGGAEERVPDPRVFTVYWPVVR